MNKIILLILFSILSSSCSVISYRTALREEENKNFEQCYNHSHNYRYCKEMSFEKMNRTHEILMSIKSKNKLKF